MRPISRRHALQLAGLGVLSAAVGGTGIVLSGGSRLDPAVGAQLSEPEALRSEGGVLRLRLEAAEGSLTVAGRRARAYGYNGSLPGPTLRLRPGDRLQVQLVNRLDAPTNLHVHGLYVSPEGKGDNVFVTVQPGETFDYDYRLPDDHPPGVYWYHPHHHGMVADQVFGGLYGAILVEDPQDLPVARERVLVVSDITLDGAGRLQQPSGMDQMMGREGDLVLVNGQVRPSLTARPGERERWRIVNACAARYVRLRLDGQRMDLLGIDSGRYPEPRSVEEVVLATGNRADVLVTTTEGSSALEVLGVDRGGMGAMGGMMGGSFSGDVGTVATLEVTGGSVTAAAPIPPRPEPRDLRGVEPAGRRRLVFAMGMGGGIGPGGMSFTIDGREFDPDRVDQEVVVGAVEEWTIGNTSPMGHPMHLHVWPMQIVAEDGRPVDDVRWQDVVNVPAGGEVTVRISFDRFGGRTVYHCHILDHEDRGMMGVVEAR
ncbi:Multicopper oxidase with three cupredoxin domains (includes cell division protein FtsP and spore coat protein CotA) [Blastococcus aggregatus]|uniref:Multicopper oxidase with three cupredoxin domains (Includes cell division protein FtsP and spore coat protein CotA) n=1 Tax=Blastococcus aggregatus TaxID=38502 RepID=A0A285V7V9_9ACTN|nr:Multicopper oxidase with three cupredoxin domains (includes cell division protein FtsP and spore coat protein CotA) [Blastococcus aggregatus]